MRVWISLLLVTLALAGCAEEPAKPVENTDDGAFEELEAEVTEDTGIIRGLVLDPAVVPVAGVTVTIQGLGTQAVTNDDGAFLFGDLDAGTYFLSAAKLGFSEVQQAAEVVAGVEKPDIVKFRIEPDPSTTPFTELDSWQGYLQCGAGLGPVGSTNPCAFTGSDNVHDFTVQRAPSAVQVEMIWKGTNTFGETLSIGMLRPGTLSNFAGADSGSPAIFQVPAEQLNNELGEGFESYTVRVFPGTEGGTTVSVVAEQRFDVYATNFYGFLPDEGWAFVNDGTHEPPQ